MGRAPSGTYSEVVGVAWPIVVSMLSYTFMGVADTLLVAHLGTTEVAAVGLATTATFAITCFGAGMLAAVKVVASQAWGGGKPARSRSAAYQGLLLAVVLGVIALALMPTASWIMAALGGVGEVHALGVDYFRIRLWGAIPSFVALAAFGYFQGLGDTKTPMRISVLANLLNVGLDLILIFGAGPVSAMGTDGAAVATVIAFGVQGALGLWVLLRATGGMNGLALEGMGEILRLGFPIGVRYLLEVLSWAAFTGVVARQGEAHLAAHVIAIRIISVSFLPGNGIGEAACVLTGQAVGAADMSAAHRVTRTATVIGLGVMGFCALIFLCFGNQLLGVFNPEPEVLVIGGPLLLIAAAFQLFDAIAMIKTGALNGAGDTRYVMLVSVGCAWLVLVPLGYLLCVSTSWGAPGAWLAITLHIIVLAAVFSRRWGGSVAVERAVRQLRLATES